MMKRDSLDYVRNDEHRRIFREARRLRRQQRDANSHQEWHPELETHEFDRSIFPVEAR